MSGFEFAEVVEYIPGLSCWKAPVFSSRVLGLRSRKLRCGDILLVHKSLDFGAISGPKFNFVILTRCFKANLRTNSG